MRVFLVMFVLALAVMQAITSQPIQAGEIGPHPSKLKVLYAGNPDSARMKEFEEYLAKHFLKVGTCNFEEFTRTQADEYDVVVFDWTSIYPRDADGKIDHSRRDIEMPRINVDRAYTKPTVMIGAAAGVYCNSRPMAIDWKCLCLENYAHDVDESHPVFQGPIPVTIEYETIEKPADYYLYPGTQKLGEKIQAWKIQSKTFPEADPGLVSHRQNFANTQDAEAISGGINGKGPTSVAIARHGNFMLWGFSGSPSELTDSAKNAFVNCLCYVTAFGGKPLTPAVNPLGTETPETFVASLYFLRSVSDEYIAIQVEHLEKVRSETQIPKEQLDIIGDDPAAYFRKMMEPTVKSIRERIPQTVIEETNGDTEKLISYYEANKEKLKLDEDNKYIIATEEEPASQAAEEAVSQ